MPEPRPKRGRWGVPARQTSMNGHPRFWGLRHTGTTEWMTLTPASDTAHTRTTPRSPEQRAVRLFRWPRDAFQALTHWVRAGPAMGEIRPPDMLECIGVEIECEGAHGFTIAPSELGDWWVICAGRRWWSSGTRKAFGAHHARPPIRYASEGIARSAIIKIEAHAHTDMEGPAAPRPVQVRLRPTGEQAGKAGKDTTQSLGRAITRSRPEKRSERAEKKRHPRE